MIRRHLLATLTLAAAGAAAPALATDLPLPGNGQWSSFAVDSFLSEAGVGTGWIDDAGAPLTFSFAIGAGMRGTLTVVDAAFAGDSFSVTNFGVLLGLTSSVPVGSFESAVAVGTDFNAALADTRFSRGVFSLGSGSYRIGGALAQSVTLGGAPLNATVGGLRLDVAVAPVPEPSSLAMLFAGFGVTGLLIRRRRANRR